MRRAIATPRSPRSVVYLVLITLIVLDVALLIATAVLGALIASTASVYSHFLWGLGTTILVVFTHLLVLFYLIGSEGDIKEALENEAELAAIWIPRVKALKRGVFPLGCAAVLTIILASMFGAEVHSRLLLARPPDEPPAVREVGFWWLHLAVVILAFGVNVAAFWRELRTVISNRRGIREINLALLANEPIPAPVGTEAETSK